MILNDIAWAHYRIVLYNELYRVLKTDKVNFKVVHIASFSNMYESIYDATESCTHKYPYVLLFNKNFDETRLLQRIFFSIKEIVKFMPNVLVVHGYYDVSLFIAVITAKLLNVKIIVSIDSTEFDKSRMLYKEIYKTIFLKLCDAAFCPGSAAKKYIQKLKMEKSRIFIVNSTPDYKTIEKVWLETFKNREEIKRKNNFRPYNFLYVGRLSKEKNLEMLIRSFSRLKNENNNYEDWGLIIVGSGQEEAELKRNVRGLNIPGIFFTGKKKLKEVLIYYAISDVLVLPSMGDTWGIVVNEAMICGLPVIVSNKCGSAYDLVKENGFIFDPNDDNNLTEIMLKFVNKEVSASEMGEKSKDIIREYSPEASAKQFLQGIDQVLSKTK